LSCGVTKQNVYDEYRQYCLINNQKVYSESSFYRLWSQCFPYIHIRPHSALMGKCVICSKLDQATFSTNDESVKLEVYKLRALHKASIKDSKKVYYANQIDAEKNKRLVYSLISDGMAQVHNELPNLGNRLHFDPTLDTHLQGTLAHGDHLLFVRTFDNITKGANLAIHVFLMDLELLYKKNKFLPKTVHFQIDGGSENVNRHTLGICEILVASRLIETLNVSRLPPGHTHEDIDAMFSIVSRHNRDKFISCPSHHQSQIETAFTNQVVDFRDVMVLPDYMKWLDSACQKSELSAIKNFAKGDHGQLLWRFQAVDVCDDFPLGVKTQYRMYAIDTFWDIREAKELDLKNEYKPKCNFVAIATRNKWEPQDGVYFMTKFPMVEITPVDFVDKCWEEVDKTVAKALVYFSCLPKGPEIIHDWKQFASKFPRTVSAADYLRAMQTYVYCALST
jgi:hypothetical protein